MDQGLKQILSNYTLSYNATKNEFNQTKKAFAEIKYASSFTQQDLDKVSKMARHLFQTCYFLMESHNSAQNVYNNFDDETKEKIDAYHLLSKRVHWLNKVMNDFVKENKNNVSTIEDFEIDI